MIATTAIEEIRARIGELTADFWTSNEVLRAINEGVRRFSSQEKWPWLYTSVTNGSLAANTATFALPEGVDAHKLQNVLVTFSGDTMPRMPRRVTPAEGVRLRTQFYTQASEPIAYYVYSEADADADTEFITTLRFVPPMSRAATIEYTYQRDPGVVTGSTETIDMPEEYCMGVVAYATGLLWLKELQDSRKADEQFALYRSIVDDAKREWRKHAGSDGFAWGRSEPELGFTTEADYTYRHFSGTLGP